MTLNLCCFPGSIDKVSKVTSPVLVIHGTEDEVIDFSHGLAIHDKCPKAVEPLWVEVSTFRIVCYFIFMASNYLLFLYKQKGAGHNDVELYSQYLDRLKQFVSVELAN